MIKNQAIFLRAFKEIVKNNPKAYVMHLIKAFCDHSLVFINLIYMSQILNELANNQFAAVKHIVGEYLIIFTILRLISDFLGPMVDDEKVLVRRKISEQPYEKMMRMNFHYADQADTHEKLHRISRDMVQNHSSMLQIATQLFDFVENVIRFVWALLLLMPLWKVSVANIENQWRWINSSWLTFLLVILIIISTIMQTKLMQRVYNFVGDESDKTLETNAMSYYITTKLYDSENGKEIRLYNLHKSLKKISQEHTISILDWYKKYYSKNQLAVLLTNIASQFLTWFLYLLIGVRVLIGSLPLSLVIQLSGALSQLIAILPQFLNFVSVFAQVEPLERYFEIMDYPEEETKGSLHVEKRLDYNYEIGVAELYFAYPEAEDYTLKNITEQFEIGKKYAIVGENGSGKTTFIKVLMRLYEATQGQVIMNNIAAEKYSLSEYYQLFSVVFQDYRLLSFTIGQNISVGRDYHKKQADLYAQQVGLKETLEELPLGLDTYLGQEFESDGINLSGGQAQKVAIARALYKDGSMMILDEPTAALDPIAEFEIYQKFSTITQNKTAFFISHRLSSCRFCDEILVFDAGEIIQRGSHDELLAKEGKYQELWQAQAQYYV